MEPYVVSALKIIGAPRHIVIQSKRVSPGILFSPALGESILFWLGNSISSRLHGEHVLGSQVVVDKDRVSGTYVGQIEKSPSIIQKNMPNQSLASGLLILSESAEQILAPAKKDRNYDFADLIVGFRDIVSSKYNKGDFVLPTDFDVADLFNEVVFKKVRMTPTPSVNPRRN